jgi:hypothetical protein
MNRLAAILALLCSPAWASVDGGQPDRAVAVTGGLIVTNGGESFEPEGGCYFPKGLCLSRMQELSDLRLENARLKAVPAPPLGAPEVEGSSGFSLAPYIITALVGVIVGGGFVFWAVK